MTGSAGPHKGQVRVADDAPRRAAGRYVGSKVRLAPWIIGHLPADHDVYVEPFGGLAAVLLRKARSRIEVFNDLDDEIVTFFRALRDDPARLLRAIRLTPYAYREWQRAFDPTDDPVERARRFYVRACLSVTGPTGGQAGGWARQTIVSRGRDGRRGAMTARARTFMGTGHLARIAGRLRGVVIEAQPALTLMTRYDHRRTLFYLDPPYDPASRSGSRAMAYRHEMSTDDHAALLDAAAALEGMVLISGYASPLYAERLADWRRVDARARVNGAGAAVESLWINRAADETLRHADLPLFASAARRRGAA